MSAFRPPAEPTADRRIGDVERLAALLAQGALSREEFEHEKRRVLGAPADRDSASWGADWERRPRALPGGRPIGTRLGWFILGLVLLALVAWITLASPDPRAAPVMPTPADAARPGGAGGEAAGLTPATLAGGWADERLGCSLGEKDWFDYFAADGRYGGWGGFGGYTDEGSWALDGGKLTETITHHTRNNESRDPERLRQPEVRTFAVASPGPDRLVVTGPTGGVGRLRRCPEAHFQFSAKD